MQILVVDDSRTSRAMIRKTIEMARIECEGMYEAQDGEEALALLAAKPVDLVITDINMPRVDGVGLLKRIQADEKLSRLRVIVVATDTTGERQDELRAYGAHAFVQKPFAPEDIAEAITGELV